MSFLDNDNDSMIKYMAQTAVIGESMDWPEELIYGAVAATVHAGTTIWNSLTPERMEASTEDLLSRIDASALQVYNEHPDAVQTASFFAGAVAPVGIALKGMNALRAGSKGVSWFSDAGRASRMTEVKDAFEASGAFTSRSIAAQNAVYKAKALNQLADTAAAEFAIIGAMAAHPWMEDYQKDFGTNFAINMALGGVIGVGVGHIIARGEVGKVKQLIQGEFQEVRSSLVTATDPAAHAGEQFQIRTQNIHNIQAHLDAAADPKNPLVLSAHITENLKLLKQIEQVRLLDDFARASSDEIGLLSAPQKTALAELMGSKDFAGMDSIKFLQVDREAITGAVKPGMLQEVWQLTQQTLGLVKDGRIIGMEVTGKLKKNDGIYSPVFQRWMGKEDAVHYSTLADLGTSVKTLETKLDNLVGIAPRADASIEAAYLPTALVQEDFAKALLRMQGMEMKELMGKTIAMSPSDLASMKAVYIRMNQLMAAGEDISSLKFVLTDAAPSWEVLQKVQLSGAGFSPTYMSEIAKLNQNRKLYQVYNGRTKTGTSSLSQVQQEVFGNWLHGSYSALRLAAIQLVNPSLDVKAGAVTLSALKAMKNSPESHAFRLALSKLADADGNVLMYRGLRADPKGHHALESFSLSPGKAGAFTGSNPSGLRLYKVHVDEVMGTMEDFATTQDIGHSNMEILVARSATRENAVIPKSDLNAMPSKFFSEEGQLMDTVVPTTETISKTIGLNDISEAISNANIKAIRELSAVGQMSAETISLRTGTPLDTVLEILSTKQTSIDASALIQFGDNLSIEAALRVENRALVIGTNVEKYHAAMRANLNAMTNKNLSQNLIEMYGLSSPSEMVRGIVGNLTNSEAKLLLHFIEKESDQIVAAGMGTTLLRSANSVLERLGPVGAYITAFGKKVIDAKNVAKERFTTPLSHALSSVAKTEASLLEFNTAINLNASLSGARFYKAGQFWKQEAGNAPIQELIAMDDVLFLQWAAKIDELKLSKNARAINYKETLDGKGIEFRVASKSVDDALKQMQAAGRELYDLKNVEYKALGKGNLSDIGFWAPANNPRGKQIAYAFNTNTQETTMILAKTPAELNTAVADFKKSLGLNSRDYHVVTKGTDQATYNQLADRHDPMYMAVADATKQHGGASATAQVSTTSEGLADLVQGYDHYIGQGIDRLAKMQLTPIMDKLDDLTAVAMQGFDPGSLNVVQQALNKPKDPGQIIKNILMGRSNLEEHQFWVRTQQGMQIVTDMGLKALSDLVAPFLGKGIRTADDWQKLVRDMDAQGIVNPFQVLVNHVDELGKQGTQIVPDIASGQVAFLRESGITGTEMTPRAVALFNATAATVMLRFMELAQPLVNMLSLPILTSGAINKQMARSFMGASLDPMAKFSTTEAMYNGIRLMNHSTLSQKWDNLAESANLFKSDWREVNGIMRDIRTLDKGLMSRAEAALDSNLVTMMSKPADWSEQAVRRVAYFTAVHIAKKAYPNLPDSGVVTFARNFMDEAIGNYAAAQRPSIFQGTVGVALGLFQTYMLTMGQQMFRQIETRNWRALGTMMLTQNTIFGTASLPGFHPVSEAIGTHFSDTHTDLESGTFRAIGDEAGQILLYGLPSQLVGVNTRGDIQPRIPNPFGGVDTIAAVNMTKQAFNGIERVVKAAFTADANTGQAMLEALSLQSISRPVARWSELAAGRSITSSGKTIQDDSEMYTTHGVISRLMATRPIEEIQLRSAMHLNTLYGSIDRDKRKAVTFRLKSYMENGTLDQEKLSSLSYEYMRTGTPTGWRGAVNEAIGMTGKTGVQIARDELNPKSSVNEMIDGLD